MSGSQARDEIRSYLRKIITPASEADRAANAVKRMVAMYVAGPPTPPVTPSTLEFCRRTITVAEDLYARLNPSRAELAPYIHDFVIEDWHGGPHGAELQLLSVRSAISELLQSLGLHHGVQLDWRKNKKGRPLDHRRQTLEIWLVHLLIHHGVRVSVSRDGKLARLMVLVHDAAGIQSGTDLFRVVKRAIHFAKKQRTGPLAVFADPYDRLQRWSEKYPNQGWLDKYARFD